MAIRRFVPCYIDHFQAASCTHVATELRGTQLVAIFSDGSESISVYPSVGAMLAAGERDFRERMREVTL